jgi:PAS domain S-box-containing protein
VAAIAEAARGQSDRPLPAALLQEIARKTAAVFEDELRQAESRTALLRESEGRYRALFEMSGDAVFLIDANGRIREANATAARMHGYTVDELTAMRITELDTPESAQQSPARVKEILAGKSLTFEVQHRRKDGSHFTLEVTASPVHLNGEVFVLAFDRDITARVRAEAQRAQLESSLRLAKRLEAIGTLAGGVAHDFNNLLGGMCGYVEIVKDRLPGDHTVQPTLGQALELGQRARELMRKILTFSQQTDSDFKCVDLATVVAEGLSLSRFTLPGAAELHTAFAPGCPAIAADPTQIHQVVLNLCTNAAHALPDRGGRIDVSVASVPLPEPLALAHPLLAEGAVVRLAVTDNGCGMDAATQERIFEPFFTTKEAGKGTGLGLSVVHGIVSAHRGAIAVQSVRGRGTTFELYFPALPAAAPDAPGAVPPRGYEETILWVDDNPATGQVIEHLLILSGFHVVHCNSASDALARCRAAPDSFDLLLTDLAMPDLNGEELARAVRALRPDLPVLVVTGMVEPAQADALADAGVREIVFKPVRREDLARVIARHLPARGAARPPANE